MILSVENAKESTKTLLELISSTRLQDTRPIYKNQLHFYVLSTNNPKNEINKTISFKIASKRIKYYENHKRVERN